jgi:hypothetical protein
VIVQPFSSASASCTFQLPSTGLQHVDQDVQPKKWWI